MQGPLPEFSPAGSPSSLSSTCELLFYVDSGAGQSMCSCPDAFLSLRPCAIEVIGVSGSLPIFGVGTAMFVLTAAPGLSIVALIHDCLLSPFNLLSVSQLQAAGLNSVDFSIGAPALSIWSRRGTTTIPLFVLDGLYAFHAEPIHPNDDRYQSLHRFHLTARPANLSTFRTSPPTAIPSPPRGFTGIVSSWPDIPLVTDDAMRSSVATHLGQWSC
jgi:hypothetical protein